MPNPHIRETAGHVVTKTNERRGKGEDMTPVGAIHELPRQQDRGDDMDENSKNHLKRKDIRLKYYDYSMVGLYFITVCTLHKANLFGNIDNGKMIINEYGEILDQYWNEIPQHYPGVELLEYVIMPNHFHGILLFTKYIGNNNEVPVGAIHELPLQRNERRRMGLPRIIGRFKMQSAKKINILRNTPGQSVWQRTYEHIIRNEKEYLKTAEYIINNPLKWMEDKYACSARIGY